MIGREFGSYRIVEEIGTGRVAIAYKAYDPDAGRYVAVKIIPQQYAHGPLFRARFVHDFNAIVQFEHPHILPIYAFGEHSDIAYVVMRYLHTATLKDRIAQGRLSLPEAAAILTRAASALDYAHERGILHLDVKPSNIVFDEEGTVYLTDFGIAGMVEAAFESTGAGQAGTPAYMSPEQCQRSSDLGPACDQYSLGVVAYEMLAGCTPFQAETPRALLDMTLSGPVPPLRSQRPDLPESVQAAILKALAKEPGDRWPTCSHVANALNRAFF